MVGDWDSIRREEGVSLIIFYSFMSLCMSMCVCAFCNDVIRMML